MNGPRRTTAVTALTILACARGGTDGDAAWQGTVETLPNGAVRVVNPPEGLWERAAAWRLAPELTLGAVEGPEAELFASISGVELDGAGRVYVLDRQTNELRIFTAEGAHVRTVGRTGEGPGEYSAANGLEWLAADTLLVVDQRGGRYSILTSEGDYVRSVPRRLSFYGWSYGGGVGNGWIWERSSVRVGPDESYPALLGTAVQGPEVVGTAPAGEGLVVAPAAGGDTIRLPRPEAPAYESFSVRNERGAMFMSVPFAPSAVYHLTETGELWHGHGGAPRLFRSTLAGDTVREVVLAYEPSPVTDAELDEWQAGESIQRFRGMGGELDLSRIPEVKPFFDDVYVAPDGHAWLSVPAGPMQTAFAVVDPEGRYLGRLEVDGVRRDVYVEPAVRGGRLLFAGRDALDVPHVYVFRIER